MSTQHYHDNLRDKNNVCANVFVKKITPKKAKNSRMMLLF